MEESKIKLISKERVYHGHLNVDKITFQHQKYDGSMSKIIDRECVVRNDAIAVLLYNSSENNYWFVEQVRIPTLFNGNGYLWECVAGLIDDGETAEDAAKREVLEEVGYAVHHLEHISTFYSTPGGCSEKVRLYFAHIGEKQNEGGGLSTENEDIKIVKYTAEELKQMYFDNQIEDGKTLLAIQWLFLHYPQIYDNNL
ncbi:NUDIX hydrolase [Flammeovirga sp. MY04]|uniref:NUDIX domain-containing protein n=1 Tax=Flammeovirga sp. MY04 TaxID=1191459 RepID=UPI0008063317|nr:NUDIX hydrolase [Flammeovirga sp. MY04]ANQ47981.1 NUDIX hydrolase [Flammeovirga sp. MY04]